MPVDLMFVEDLLLVHSISSLFSHMAEVGGYFSRVFLFIYFLLFRIIVYPVGWGGAEDLGYIPLCTCGNHGTNLWIPHSPSTFMWVLGNTPKLAGRCSNHCYTLCHLVGTIRVSFWQDNFLHENSALLTSSLSEGPFPCTILLVVKIWMCMFWGG